MSSEKALELYYDHYKDSFTYLKGALTSRDKVFYITVAVMVLVFFQSSNPGVVDQISIVLVKKNIDDSVYISIKFINSLVLFVFLSLIIKYFQLNLLIERQYPYIHALEEELTSKLSVKITREGKTYEEAYPFVLSVIHRVYSLVFPGLLISVIIIRFCNEYDSFKSDLKSWYFIFDTFILLFILAITLAYLSWSQFRDFKKLASPKESVVLEAPEVLVAPELLADDSKPADVSSPTSNPN